MYACPLSPAIPSIPAQSCPVDFEQILRLLICKIDPAADALSTAAEMFDADNWTARLAATNATKVVLSPIFSGLTFPRSEARTEGSADNNSVGGMASVVGQNPVEVKFILKSVEAAIAEAMRGLTPYSLPEVPPGIGVYLVNRFGQIISNAGLPIRVYNFNVSSVGSEGYGARNTHEGRFTLPEGWDKTWTLLTPPANADFKPLEI